MQKLFIGDFVRFANDHGLVMEGQILDQTELAARVWTPIAIYIVEKEKIIRKVAPNSTSKSIRHPS